MAEYKQGQVVKVDIPKTYGIISKVTHDETFSWVETYWVKFMKPFMKKGANVEWPLDHRKTEILFRKAAFSAGETL